jgi:serine/threonine protein kinase
MEESVDPTTLFTKQECIGGGSFGKVYKGLDRKSGQTVAIKVIDVENAEDEVEDIMGEIMILSGLKSPYVTKYYGSYLHGSDLWIVMEFCAGGSCADLMKPGPLAEAEIAVMLKELLMGLTYLHEDHKLHRDIKGERPAALQPPFRETWHTDWHSCEYSCHCKWSGEACGLWRIRSAIRDHDQEEYIRRHAVLDGT